MCSIRLSDVSPPPQRRRENAFFVVAGRDPITFASLRASGELEIPPKYRGLVHHPVSSLTTYRLNLRQWRDEDRVAFTAMNADPEVMSDLGGTLGRAASDRKLERFDAAFETFGYGRWVIDGSVAGEEPGFLGYAGVMPNREVIRAA